MIFDYKTYEDFSIKPDVKFMGSVTSLMDFRKLAVMDDIKDIEYDTVNRIALYAHNKFKKAKSFKKTLVLTVDNPYKLWGFTEFDVIQFILDKKTWSAYFNFFYNGNRRILQIVCERNDLGLLFHEIQHAVHHESYGSHDYVNDIWDVGEIMKIFDARFSEIDASSQKEEYNDIYSFFHIIYTLFPDEVEANMVEIYQQLLKLKTTRRSFDQNLKECDSCIEYFEVLQERERGLFLNKWKRSPAYRVDFFSQIKFLFDNMKEYDKIRLRANPLFRRLFFGDRQIKVIYDKKISQKEANEEANFWDNHIKERTEQVLRKINLMKFLFKNDKYISYP
jgi:hypothetical protein